MLRLSTIIFYSFLTLVFLIEGLGVRNGHYTSLFIIIVMPFFCYIPLYREKIKIVLSPTLIVLFLLFIFFSSISTVFSVNIQNSFIYLLLYIALFLVFIYVQIVKEDIKKIIIPFIFYFSFIFSIVSLVLIFYVKNSMNYFLPVSGFQMVFSVIGSHNHLGDFLVLPLLISIYRLIHNAFSKFNLFVIIFFLPFFITSFSRSAYMTLGIVAILMVFFYWRRTKKIQPLTIIIVCLINILLLFFFLFSVSETRKIEVLQPVHSYVEETFDLGSKRFTGRREDYYALALVSIAHNPLVGLGPNNFIYASEKYSEGFIRHSSLAHNFFLEISAENGIPVGIILLLIIFLIIYRSKRDIYFFLFLALLVNFQTDYTYAIYSLLLLLFILLGTIYKGQHFFDIFKGKVIIELRHLLFFSLIIYLIVFFLISKYIFSVIFI